MTRAEFIDEVTEWWELIDFCNDNRCEDLVENLYSEDARNEYIDDCLVDWAHDNGWRDLLDILRDYENEDGYDYYVYDEYYGRYVGATTDDFRTYKDEVLRYADENDLFDAEEDEEEEESDSYGRWGYTDESNEDEEEVPDEDCSFTEMFAAGIGCVAAINSEAIRQAQEEERSFLEFAEIGR